MMEKGDKLVYFDNSFNRADLNKEETVADVWRDLNKSGWGDDDIESYLQDRLQKLGIRGQQLTDLLQRVKILVREYKDTLD